MNNKILNQVRKKISEEEKEIFNSVKKQVIGESSPRNEKSLVDEIITQGGKVQKLPEGYESSTNESSQKRINELEEELRQIRLERQKKLNEHLKSQQDLLQKQHVPAEQAPLIQQTKKKRFMPFGGSHKSKGSGEMLKAKK